MSIKVTFEFDSPEAAAAFLLGDEAAALAGGGAAAPKGRGRPRKEAAAEPAASAAPATSAAAPSASVQTTAAASPAVDFKAVADAITELADKDLAAAKAILGKYGVPNARGLKPEQFAGVVADAKAALAAPVPTAGGLI